jgi:hypothetical protein
MNLEEQKRKRDERYARRVEIRQRAKERGRKELVRGAR